MNTQEHMVADLKSKARNTIKTVRSNIEMIAETYAEIYVSSTLGLGDGKNKQNIKDEYVEEFINEVKRIM